MKITINTEQQKTPLENFWNHIHFHPTDAAEDIWGQRVLNQAAEDGVAQFVRLHTMFEDIVTRDRSGELKFDFTESDIRLDYMVEKGFYLLLCFDFMPPCMSLDQRNVSNIRYKNKTYNRSQPSSYEEWGTVCRVYTQHLIDRYGENRVSNWHFHCWNEPDAGYWVSTKGNDEWDADGDTDKIDEYIKLYDYFEHNVHTVNDKIKVGGPSCAGSDRFVRLFLEHCHDGKNLVTGNTGTRIDFASVHCYSQGIYSNLPNKSFTSPENVMQRMRTLRSIMDQCGFTGLDMLLDEFGIAGGGFLGIDTDPRMVFRETEYFSAFYARLIELIANAPELKMRKIMICLSGQDHCVKDFDGFRTFFTANGYRKPIYNGYALAAKLGDMKLEYSGTCSENTGILPTADSNGAIKVMLYNFEDDFYGTIDSAKFELELEGLRGKYLVRHYRIDKSTSNAYAKWAELGCPQVPTMLERDYILRAGMLSTLCPDEHVELNGSFKTDIILGQNAVSLLEIIPE